MCAPNAEATASEDVVTASLDCEHGRNKRLRPTAAVRQKSEAGQPPTDQGGWPCMVQYGYAPSAAL
jgi:hypothetical protein